MNRGAIPVPPTPEEAFARCQALFTQGRFGELHDAAASAIGLLAGPAHADGRFELLRLRAIAAVELGRFETALDTTERMVQEALDAGDAGRSLLAAFALGGTFERMGDPWQGLRVLERALADHLDAAPPRARLIALNGLVAVSIGTWHRLGDAVPDEERLRVLQRAAEAGERAAGLVAEVRDVAYEVALAGNLGEVLVHLGRLDEAGAMLEQAREGARRGGLHAHGWRIEASRGDWLLAQGRAAEAQHAMLELLHAMGDAAPLPTELRVRHVAYRAAKALSDPALALAHFEQYERLERRRAVRQLLAQSELFVTRVEALQTQQQFERARQDAAAQRERAAEMAHRAEHDALTGLGNRHQLDGRLAALLPAAAAGGQPLALALIDIDHFKRVNDRHGHAVGDAVLVELAQLLRESTRGADVLVRLGGEEFVVVLPGAPRARAEEICERLRQRVATRAFAALPPAEHLTVSVGLALAPAYEQRALLARADDALYAAKNAGRNRVCVAD